MKSASGVTYESPADCPSIRPSENLNIGLYPKTIRATVTKFGTKVLYYVALQNIYTVRQPKLKVKVKKVKVKGYQKTLQFFSKY